ncbi:GtrA family protein [Solihabitans fulvus]|uniref:GtrA family protein n=1 Tax=Solihabitans fulvus TaxID=1892852 RepID=A0A5B2XB99_9PSEU|nr:GtrA family protein [Solihabitans fulvus]KAA2260907.1 GtrA family protein [Solihabitans fulvus]
MLHKHRELLKFAVVGGTTFVIDNGLWYVLKHTVLAEKVLTAKAISVLVATIASYVLSREWSFRTRGGRERHHEAALFFVISGIGIGLTLLPLWVSRYLLDLRMPTVSLLTQEIADFVSGSILGMLLAMVFRFWAMKKWVFPEAGARPEVVRSTRANRRLRVVDIDEDHEQVA